MIPSREITAEPARTKKIAYCGSLAENQGVAQGGVESGNRAIISELGKRGWVVVEYPYPSPERDSSRITKVTSYVLGFARLYTNILRDSKNWALFHFAGHYHGYFILFPFLLLKTLRLLDRKFLFHIRAGSLLHLYQTGSRLFRWALKNLLSGSDAVAVQGLEFSDFVATYHGKAPLYLPNFVQSEPNINPECHNTSESLRLLFLSRLSDEKGVDIALQTKRILDSRGYSVEMKVIGGGNASYVENLKTAFPDENVEWIGPVEHSRVRSSVSGCHFFIFPTRWAGEGQSNALTESMAEGIVPICSDQGFNQRIIEGCGRVLDNKAEAEDYARTIIEIWRSGTWADLSRAATERVRTNYLANNVIKELTTLYEDMTGTPASQKVLHCDD